MRVSFRAYIVHDAKKDAFIFIKTLNIQQMSKLIGFYNKLLFDPQYLSQFRLLQQITIDWEDETFASHGLEARSPRSAC